MTSSKDTAVGFYIYSNGVKWEPIEGMFNTWTILKDDEVEVENYTYRRAMQIVINRIGAGDIY